MSDKRQRKSLDSAVALGPLYALLNYIAPLARLYAISSFIWGHAEWPRQVLPPVIGSLAASILHVPLTRLVEPAAALNEDGEESSSSAHARVISLQAVRLALLLLGAGAGGVWLDAVTCALRSPSGLELGMGAGAGTLMCAAWTLAARAVPRERLTVDPSNQAPAAATEDEMLRSMPRCRRAASLGLRCAAVAVAACGDTLLVFVFLPAVVDGVEPPASPGVLAACLAALTYGSMHLRFRGEWALAAGFGLGLAALREHAGSLTPVLGASVVFAAFRHRARTHEDVQQFKST